MTTPPRKIRDRHLNCAIYTSILILSVFEIADPFRCSGNFRCLPFRFEISSAFPLYRKSGLFVLGLLEWVLTKITRLSLFDLMSVATQPLTSVIGHNNLTTRGERSWGGRRRLNWSVIVSSSYFLRVPTSTVVLSSHTLLAKFRLIGPGTFIHYTLLMF